MSTENNIIAAFAAEGLITITNFKKACGSYLEVQNLVEEIESVRHDSDLTSLMTYNLVFSLTEGSKKWSAELVLRIADGEKGKEITKELSEPMAIVLQQALQELRFDMEDVTLSVVELQLFLDSEGIRMVVKPPFFFL